MTFWSLGSHSQLALSSENVCVRNRGTECDREEIWRVRKRDKRCSMQRKAKVQETLIRDNVGYLHEPASLRHHRWSLSGQTYFTHKKEELR